VTTKTLAARVPPLGWVLLVSAALLLTRLGSFGFWEPWEARLADPSNTVSAPPFLTAVLGASAHLGGEAGARSLFALLALGAVAAVYWAGAGLFSRRAAALGAIVLVTLPLFSFQARQLISDMPLVLSLALSLGLGRYFWGKGRVLDLIVGVAGLVLGYLSGGALVGVAVPCAAVAGTLLAAGGSRRWLAATGALAVLLLAACLLRTHTAGTYSGLLGGVPRLGTPAVIFDWLLPQLGFGLFPWGALAFFALVEPLGEEDRPSPARLYLLIFAAFAVALATVRGYLVGEGRFAGLAPIALALGAFLAEGRERPPERIVALLAGVGAVLVGRDLYLEPELLFSLHTLEKVKWPVVLGGQAVLLGTGIAFALALWIALALRRRAGTTAIMGVALAFTLALTQGLVPALSQHLSPRRVIDSYRRAATAGEPLARYRVAGEGASALRSAPGPTLYSPQEVASLLGRPARAFVVVAAEELAPIDEALKTARVSYAVLDASSSRLLLLGNRPEPGFVDQNPLRKNVWLPGGADERPPWPAPRLTTSTTFADAIELVGADFPESIHRPGTFKLVLIFRVLKKPPAGHNIFVHLSKPGEALVNGDHPPLGGAFPMAHWVPGELVRDESSIELPLALTSAGTYQLNVGVWPGGNRPGIKITAGNTDGHDSAPLGAVVIK
jgi:4-amino-4-deoxy-L-arabinose transferase-like glycosyltransferase